MTYDAELNLIVCEHATSSLVRERAGRAARGAGLAFRGPELNSPNDVCVRSDGSIYFSDPWYGRMPVYGVERPRQLGFQGVYRVRAGPAASRELLVDRYLFDQPNGLCFCPTEQRLYVNDTAQALIRVFDVRPDGTLADPRGRVFASGIRSELEPGVPDGMKCDAARQRLGHRAGRRLGLFAGGRASRQGAACPSSPPTCLGRPGFPHALSSARRTRSIRCRPRSGRGRSPIMRPRRSRGRRPRPRLGPVAARAGIGDRRGGRQDAPRSRAAAR